MNKRHTYIKKGITAIDICCILMSLIFLFQIKEQEKEEKDIADINRFLQDSEEIQMAVDEAKIAYNEAENRYKIRLYIDALETTFDKSVMSHNYIDKYFMVEKQELQEIITKVKVEERFAQPFDRGGEWDGLLPIGDGIWVRYEENAELPCGLMVQNPLIDIGYKDAKAGMSIMDIKGLFPSIKEERKDMEWGSVYYLNFEDEDYSYYFFEISRGGESTILYIMPIE